MTLKDWSGGDPVLTRVAFRSVKGEVGTTKAIRVSVRF